jgi:hypothetical protein
MLTPQSEICRPQADSCKLILRTELRRPEIVPSKCGAGVKLPSTLIQSDPIRFLLNQSRHIATVLRTRTYRPLVADHIFGQDCSALRSIQPGLVTGSSSRHSVALSCDTRSVRLNQSWYM